MRWTAWSTTAACVLTVATLAVPARADPEVIYPAPLVKVFVDLEYVRERGASICPGEEEFKRALAAEMGDENFTPDPRGVYVGRVRVVLSRSAGSFTSVYTWQDAQGVEHHGRHSRRGDASYICKILLDDLVLSLSIHF